jgi:hypothetical protein
MKAVIEILSLLLIGWIAGAELGSWCCVQPVVARLPYEHYVAAEQAMLPPQSSSPRCSHTTASWRVQRDSGAVSNVREGVTVIWHRARCLSSRAPRACCRQLSQPTNRWPLRASSGVLIDSSSLLLCLEAC